MKYLFILLNLIGFTAQAAPINWMPDSQQVFVQEMKKQSLLAYDQEAATEIYHHVAVSVTKNIATEHVKSAYFLPTNNSVEEYGNYVVFLNEKTEQLKLLEVASISPTGEVKRLDPDTIKVLDSDTYNTFSDSKEVVLAIPGLEAGSLMLVEYQLLTDRRASEMGWGYGIYPQQLYPRANFSIEFSWGKGEPFDWSNSSEFVSCDKHKYALTCSAESIPPIENDHNVIWRDVLGAVRFKPRSSWQDVADRSSAAFNLAFRKQDQLGRLADVLFDGAKSHEEKIARAYDFVARDIRYISYSEYGHAITPHFLDDIINNRYGDCKDKSALLVGLLKHENIHAFPVLVSTVRADPEQMELPGMNYFDHMVVCLNHQGKQYCLDPTDPDTHWQSTSSWIQGKIMLPLITETKLSTIERNQYRWRMNVKTKLDFDDQGGLSETLTREYLGEYAGSIRGALLGRNKDEREEWLLEQYQDVVSNAVTPTFTVEQLDSMSSKLKVTSEVHHPPFADTESYFNYTEYAGWMRDEINSLYVENKVYGVWFSGFKVTSEYIYDTGSKWNVDMLGPELKLKHKYGSLIRTAQKKGDKQVIYSAELAVPARYLKVEEIEAFNKFLDNIYRHSNIELGMMNIASK